jgi:hypothetical protein
MPEMSFTPLFRAMGVSRRSRRSGTVVPGPGHSLPEQQTRHPAMSGIDVSPVHGRHCICDRCLTLAGKSR